MGRRAGLSRKNGYWYSEAGGVPRYFGRVGVVSHAEARKSFHAALAEGPAPPPEPTVAELAARYLAWVGANRSERTLESRKAHTDRWCARYGSLPADAIRAEHLEEWIAGLRAEPAYGEGHVLKQVASVRQLFHRAVKMGWLGRFPFAGVEPIRVPLAPLRESDLLTRAEVDALLAWGDADLSPLPGGHGFRPRPPESYRIGAANPWHGFADLLRVYHATGARTAELWSARVGDFQPRTRQLVLGRHKRSKTQKVATSRQIHLNDAACAIVAGACAGRDPGVPIFTRPAYGRSARRPVADRPWDRHVISRRFRSVRELAGVRESITIYDFRHLWISEMLMAGVDALLVARMAGTSVAMIEQVYGHFRASSFADAQARLDAARGVDARGIVH